MLSYKQDFNYYFRYSQQTGKLYWRNPPSNGIQVGDLAGRVCKGYIQVMLKGRAYQAHRIIYAMHNPDIDLTGKLVDHIDRDTLNNNINNLRLADHRQNAANSGLSVRNTSGLKGVSYSKASSKWKASIKKGGKTKYLGLYEDPNDASEAYRLAAGMAYGDFFPHKV